MNDIPRQKLRELITTYSTSVLDDPLHVEEMLRNVCGEYKVEISVLVAAQRENVPYDLLHPGTMLSPAVLHSQLAQSMHDNLAIATDAAQWAVESWAYALGLSVPAPLPNANGAGDKRDSKARAASGGAAKGFLLLAITLVLAIGGLATLYFIILATQTLPPPKIEATLSNSPTPSPAPPTLALITGTPRREPSSTPIPTDTPIPPSPTTTPTPTNTPTTTPTPTPTELPGTPTALSDGISIGQMVEVTANGLNLHTDPNPDAPIVDDQTRNDLLRVTGGPMNVDGRNWWYVQETRLDDYSGWCSGKSISSVDPRVADISVGNYVYVAYDQLNIRDAPNKTANGLAIVKEGQQLHVVGGPNIFEGRYWWLVIGWDDRNTEGWVTGRYVRRIY